ncbi:hypothetical protein EK21DRAFT_85906 [Setomelanomma holmii]|uniref:Uncharacterized protein n=1 Tax=Setomelanomma holmii TaxID=210430 RepID=A0A9P4LQ26_9PLEO|nr:hypothetical protein EK21DRAFT_85906 [Setomelanomma holmii]
MSSARLRPSLLTIATPSWRAPRPPTPRRATFPLPGTTSTSLSSKAIVTPPVPPLSYWLPDTPSPLTAISSPRHAQSPVLPLSPASPMNPFLVPPTRCNKSALFPIASSLLPASPLSIFDSAVSPNFLLSRTPTPTRIFLLPASPISLSPRFLFPRTPPCVPVIKTRRRVSVVDAVMGRKESVTSILTLGQETMKWKIEFFQWLAVRR